MIIIHTMKIRGSVLGRIVDYEGESILSGVHSTSLPPMIAEAVVQRLRKRLRRKWTDARPQWIESEFGDLIKHRIREDGRSDVSVSSFP
jgi:hypothetical protein